MRALSVVDYLAFEEEADRKHEFWFGHTVAMAGASPAHNILAMNVGSELRQRLRKRGCLTYTADQRVKLPEGNTISP